MKRGFLNSSKTKNRPLYSNIEGEPAVKNRTNGTASDESQEGQQIANQFLGDKASLEEGNRVLQPHLMDPKEDNTMLVTTIPTVDPSRGLDPDGHALWITLGSTKRKVVQAPGYLKPIPKPTGPPSYVVRNTPDMGLGLFATRKIKVNELIFAERPLLVHHRNVGLFGQKILQSQVEGMDRAAFNAAVLSEAEKVFDFALSKMLPENRKAYLELTNSHKENGSGPLLGISRTNGYSIGALFDGPDKSDYDPYSGTCKIGSRINHSCMPNVTQEFNIASFSIQFTACRDIEAGEQLFYAYCDLNLSAAERKAQLRPYGFGKCSCAACVDATPESDKLRREYRQRIDDYRVMASDMVNSRAQIDHSVLEPVVEFQHAILKEGLHATKSYVILLGVLSQLHNKVGKLEQGKAYLSECIRYSR